MGAFGTVSDWSDTPLLNSVIGECLTIGMLAIPERLRLSILESNHVVLPIANVIPNHLAKIGWASIKSVEVHVEHVGVAVSFLIYDYCSADRSRSPSRTVWLDPFEPSRIRGDIVHRCEPDVGASNIIERREIIEGQRALSSLNCCKFTLWLRFGELGSDI